MNKMTEEEFVDYIADLTHYKPNAIDELPLEETPLMLAFTDGGDQGDELTENEELLKYYHATETDLTLKELIRISHQNNQP